MSQSIAPIDGFVAISVFAFNLFQLLMFRRHGFVSMYLMRFIYYLLWHIAWDYFR